MKQNHCKLNNKNKLKSVKIIGRKPFSDKKNLLNGSYHIEQYGECNVNQVNSKEYNKPTVQKYSNLKSDRKVVYIDLASQNIIPRKMESKVLGHFPNYETLSPSVNIESKCSESVKRYLANTSPSVNINKLSNKILQKHLKMCNVVIENIPCNKSKIKSIEIDIDKNNSLGDETVLTVRSQGQNKCHFLRNRKNIVNYAKLHDGSLFDDETYINSTPVHKKKNGKKKVLDVYEFVCDSDEDKPQKRNSLNKSVPFEKEMKVVMRKIEEQHRKLLKRKKKIGNRKIKKIQEEVLTDFEKSQFKPTYITTKVEKQEISVGMKHFNTEDKEIYKPSETYNYAFKSNGNNLKTQPVDAVRINNVPKNKINVIQNVILQKTHIMRNNSNQHDVSMPKINSMLDEENIIKTGSFEQTNNMNAKYNYVNARKQKASQCDNHNELSDSDLDIFDTADHDNLSDILDFGNVNSKSTPLNKGSTSGDSLPWRSIVHTKRNPHFLQYKPTALPSYNQDLVIDSSAVEKVYSDCKTPNESNQSGRTKQTSILSYIGRGSISKSPDIIESSLFDVHELSPIKSSSIVSPKFKSKSSVDKENITMENIPRKGIEKHKRRILGEKVDNSQNVLNNLSKSLKANQTSDSDEENSFFGFENLSNSDLNENELQDSKVKKNIWLFGKPLRIDDYITVSKQPKYVMNNSKTHAPDKKTKENAVNKVEVSNDEKEETDVAPEDEVLPIGLFEDLEQPNKHVPIKRYERKTRKRVQKRSVSSDEESEEENMKKNKDKLTKQERNDAEKWARAFNRMCQDVDKFPLEIE